MNDLSRDDLASVVATRDTCLRVLARRRRTKQELVDVLDCSRSTVDRALRALADRDLAEYVDGEWRLTLLGQCGACVRATYLDRLDTLADAGPLLHALPPDSPVDCAFLDGADVYEADTAVPDEVVYALLDRIEDATVVRGFTPTALSGYAEPFYESATAGEESRFELVLPRGVFERLQAMYAGQTARALRDERVSLYLGAVSASFGLWISDDHAGVVVYTERGIRGVVINDTDEALAWATDQYEYVRADADPVSPGEGTAAD